MVMGKGLIAADKGLEADISIPEGGDGGIDWFWGDGCLEDLLERLCWVVPRKLRRFGGV
jgi:hypothetical protein